MMLCTGFTLAIAASSSCEYSLHLDFVKLNLVREGILVVLNAD